jgi:hypothetical protein
MDLYDVGVRGFPSPLNAREISQLFRAGQLHSRVPCKPKGDATWRTIDELFPGLKYEAAAPRLHFDDEAGTARRVFLRWSKVILCLVGGLAASHFYSRPAPKPLAGQIPLEQSRVVAPTRHSAEPSSAAIVPREPPSVR